MGPNRERFLNDFPTLEAFLAGVSGVDSYHLMSGAFSLGTQDIEERTPTSIHDGLGQMAIFHQSENLKVFHHDMVMPFSIRFRRLEMVITSLAADLEMGLSDVTSSFSSSLAAFLATTPLALFASQGLLGSPVKSGILNGVAIRVGQEAFQTNVNPDITMLTGTRLMLIAWFSLTNDQSIPATVGSQNKMGSFRGPFQWPVKFYFEVFTQLSGNNSEWHCANVERGSKA